MLTESRLWTDGSAPPRRQPDATLGDGPQLTHVTLVWQEGRREDWLKFGKPVTSRIIDRKQRIESYAAGQMLGLVRWAWLVLDSPAFAAQLREWLKTLRKKNASVVFATQSLADIESSAIAPAIIESCPTRIFLPNERAVEPQILSIYRRFGLNDRQIEIVARATPKRDYYCQSARGNRLFELGLGEVALAFTATSSKTDQLSIGELTDVHGTAGFAAVWLRHRGLAWAADMLPFPEPVPPAQLGQPQE